MSEIIHDSHVELENLSRRFIEERRALKQAEDAVESIKGDIIKLLGDSGFAETENFTIEVREIAQNRMMKKGDFIKKHSPPMMDEHGNALLNPDGEPILDQSVGAKFYNEHLIESISNRFYCKKKPVWKGHRAKQGMWITSVPNAHRNRIIK